MLYTINSNTQELQSEELLTFSENPILTGYVATHSPGSTTISLNRPGFYMVHFNADVNASTTNLIQVQLLGNGKPIDGAIAQRTSADETIGNIGFTAIVQVIPNCPAVRGNCPMLLTFKNAKDASVYLDAAVTVTKLK